MTNPTLYKTTTFGAIENGTSFTSEAHGPQTFEKVSPRKAQMVDENEAGPKVPFAMLPSMPVSVIDHDAMARRDKELAKPIFDGTEASCRTRQEFYALDHAMHEVSSATEAVDKMADYIADKMASIKLTLRRTARTTTEGEQRDRFTPRFKMTPGGAMGYISLNSCGELQGNGNIDALIAVLIAKREAFASLLNALGYRVEGGR